MKTFEQAWAEMEAKGYQYGADTLENVRLGWDLAIACMAPTSGPRWCSACKRYGGAHESTCERGRE